MHEVPPVKLDSYLVDFFSTIKCRTGADYSANSFVNLRTRLDTYLKDNDYPCSITKSELFSQSRWAFARRRKSFLLKTKGRFPSSSGFGL